VEVLQDILKTCKTADDTETDTDLEGEEEVWFIFLLMKQTSFCAPWE
jgi:hypothetical protein